MISKVYTTHILLILRAVYCSENYFFMQNRENRIGRGQLVILIQVGINISCRSDCTVSKPCLNLFKANPLCEQKRGTCVSKIMKAYPRHIVGFQH